MFNHAVLVCLVTFAAAHVSLRKPKRKKVTPVTAPPVVASTSQQAIPRVASLATASPAWEKLLYQELDALWQENKDPKYNEGHSNQVRKEMDMMNQIAADPNVKTICETGFNGGHGTLRWLLHSSPQTHVYSFDLGVHTYSKPAAEWLEKKFPGRHTVIWGDSTQTIPVFRLQHPNVKCNLIFVDGGHAYPVAVADLGNFMTMADPEYNVVMMDDVYCQEDYCLGPNKAWVNMIQSGEIAQTLYEKEPQPGGDRGFALGSYVTAGTAPPRPMIAQTVPVPEDMTQPPLPR